MEGRNAAFWVVSVGSLVAAGLAVAALLALLPATLHAVQSQGAEARRGAAQCRVLLPSQDETDEERGLIWKEGLSEVASELAYSNSRSLPKRRKRWQSYDACSGKLSLGLTLDSDAHVHDGGLFGPIKGLSACGHCPISARPHQSRLSPESIVRILDVFIGRPHLRESRGLGETCLPLPRLWSQVIPGFPSQEWNSKCELISG